MKILFSAASGVALALTLATPALAEGKADRARAAIAEARAKIDAANKVGATSETPRLQADAQAALRTAEEDLARGDKDEAIAAAHHATQLADTAIGESQRVRSDTARAATADARDAAISAQQQAADANVRAASAEQAAAVASADAAAARAAPPPAPVVIAAPAPAPTTIVTTETVKTVPVSRAAPRRVVHRTVKKAAVRPATSATARVTEKTTTTVTTGNN